MAEISYDLTAEALGNNYELLADNPYPGRGIILGMNESGTAAQQVYWVMGRSPSSRNRILEIAEDPDSGTDLVRTALFEDSDDVDPLTLYNAMRTMPGGSEHVVSNGKQTDPIIEYRNFFGALDLQAFEPDNPNYTPRISGSVTFRHGRPIYRTSIIRKLPYGISDPRRSNLEIDAKRLGRGTGIAYHTYLGSDEPLPTFNIEPFPLPLGETAEETAESYWGVLNPENKVALAVKQIGMTSVATEIVIKNKHHK